MAVVAFDALGTLFDLGDLEDRMPRVLQHALSLTVLGTWEPLDELAAAIDPELAEHLPELDAYDDAVPALESVRQAGGEAWVLTNGSRAATEALLRRGGMGGLITRIHSAEEVERYKPHPRVYELLPTDATLVAAHAWDVAGAGHAGLRAIWISRAEQPWPFGGEPHEPRASTLLDAARLASRT
ncbi:MAG TPA: HAD family hydrolase [Gaiellaceae bacterium]|nr:HAD family hydrolase [Gaiellaceae bacterium]